MSPEVTALMFAENLSEEQAIARLAIEDALWKRVTSNQVTNRVTRLLFSKKGFSYAQAIHAAKFQLIRELEAADREFAAGLAAAGGNVFKLVGLLYERPDSVAAVNAAAEAIAASHFKHAELRVFEDLVWEMDCYARDLKSPLVGDYAQQQLPKRLAEFERELPDHKRIMRLMEQEFAARKK